MPRGTHSRRGKLHGGRGKAVRTPGTSAKLGFEPQLWAAANALRGSVDAAQCEHGPRMEAPPHKAR